ncbi:MAG: PD40 domain-containing protein [Anaerolineales bacterium]|nr:PD40 domain-containing protein [Anaerolineales bacterium]
MLAKPGRWFTSLFRPVWVWVRPLFLWFWRFWGRLGLALRNLLTWTIWKPIWLITMPLWLPLSWLFEGLHGHVWPPLKRFTGRVGLALRNLLTWVVWGPFFLLVIRPLRFLFSHLVWPILVWLAHKTRRFWQSTWDATEPRRLKWRRRWASRWLVYRARLRVLFQRPKPPKTAVFAPRQPRYNPPSVRTARFMTAFGSVAIVLILSFVTWQEQQPDRVSAGNGLTLPRVIIATPSPMPMTATPTSRPTIDVRLTPWPTPDPLQTGGSLAFTWRRNGNSDIYLLPVGQAEPVRLTQHPAEDRDPAWSPNGRQLAFTSRRDGNWEIYIYDLDSGDLRRVTNNLAFDGGPGWSPDGQWLVYEGYRENNLDIYIIKADLSEGPYRLTENPAPDYAPVWSPGGRHIAFTSWRSGNQDIFVMSLNEVTDEAAVNVTASPGGQEEEPVFSPDGRFLAYHDDSAGFPLLYAVPLDENYRPDGEPVSLGQQGRHPAWSPNGESLVYVMDKGDQSFLLAGSPVGWTVSPQAFVADGRLDDPAWTANPMTPAQADNAAQFDSQYPDKPLFTEALAPPEKTGPPVKLFEMPVSAPSPYLSDRVDQSFLALRQRTAAEAGWDFLAQLDNMFEAIDEKSAPGQSNQTWNKAGRAIDLAYREVLSFEPRVEVVRDDIGLDTYWRVYLRAEVQDGSQGEPLRELPWDFRARFGDEPQYYDEGGVLKETIPAGYYVDFTTLAADYGWQRVPADENWRTFFPGIGFWHYENRQGLGWEEAMLEIQTEALLQQTFPDR